MVAPPRPNPQVLILGTGIAGLSSALKFASQGAEVTLACKAEPAEGATRYAQGGIASVWSQQDSFEEHERDTFEAGAGLCDTKVVEICVKEGPERVRELIEWGVQFTRRHDFDSTASDPADAFDLHREGGHGKRRILHADDLTGWEIERALLEQISRSPRIRLLEDQVAIDLITEGKLFKRWRRPGRCLGAYLLDSKTGAIRTQAADITVIATGGAGKVYLYTSNPDTATGDGIAMAHRAGARVANLEFIQFHPTCLYHPGARTFLISEALRGEGAVLRNLRGEAFMENHHPMASLAPRDIVARAIDFEMKRTGDRHVLLDCSAIPAEEFRMKFPNILQTCLKFGIDPTQQPIPVVPAAHYTCGGILTDENARTTVEGLYAVGEAACTGLHGANRLASNSLLEAVVFAHRAVQHALSQATVLPAPSEVPGPLPEWDHGQAVAAEEGIDIAATWLEIRTLMWNYVGIVRNNRRLERAKRRLEMLRTEVNTIYWNHLLTRDLIELRNLLTIASLIVDCAISRKESRGLHFTLDYPDRDDTHFLRDTVI